MVLEEIPLKKVTPEKGYYKTNKQPSLMVLCIPLFCESISKPKTTSKPENFSEPPSNVLCPRCNSISNTVYKKDENSCKLCLCCSCPCGTSPAYLSCGTCGFNLGNPRVSVCEHCKIATIIDTEFCSCCGSKKNKF